jgi:hypothetical protein
LLWRLALCSFPYTFWPSIFSTDISRVS